MAKVFVQEALNNYDFKVYWLIHYDFQVYCFICVWNVVAWFVYELSAKGEYQVAHDWLSVKFHYSSALHEYEDVLYSDNWMSFFWMYSHTIQMAEIGCLQNAVTISCSKWLLQLCHMCLCWRVWFASCTCFQAGQMIFVPLYK